VEIYTRGASNVREGCNSCGLGFFLPRPAPGSLGVGPGM